MRRLQLVWLFLIVIFLNSCRDTNQGYSTQDARPNILFIMSDDHAQRAISAYSNELIKTPNIDRIANEGILFSNSFVTNSLCGPSRAVMLTGKFSHLNGLRDNRDQFNGDQQTWIKLIHDSGYHTSVVGKWHLRTKPQGFDNWNILVGQGPYYNPIMVENGDTTYHTGYTTSIITDLAIKNLESRDKSKPFAMLLHHKAPHRNWMPEPRYFQMLKEKDIPLPETFFDKYEGRQAAEEQDLRIDDMFLSHDLKLNAKYYDHETGTGGGPPGFDAEKSFLNMMNRFTPKQRATWVEYYNQLGEEFKNADLNGEELLRWKYKRYMQDYLGVIASVDDGVGRILDYLDENGLAENTIVVYTSDQGFYLGEHGWYDKRFMYEESMRTPLIVRIPWLKGPKREISQLVQNIDLASTFLDFAGVSIPKDMQGMSWKKLVEENGEVRDWRKSLYYHYYEYPHGWHSVKQHYGVRTDRFKLIHFYNDINTWELYDLQNDPNEMINLYGNEGMEEITNELMIELNRLREQYKVKDGV